jgi:hypothetical protein
VAFSESNPMAWGPISKNHKLQNTNYKQITYHNVQNYKQKINKKFFVGGFRGEQFFE